jgi:hypothetical protein
LDTPSGGDAQTSGQKFDPLEALLAAGPKFDAPPAEGPASDENPAAPEGEFLKMFPGARG